MKTKFHIISAIIILVPFGMLCFTSGQTRLCVQGNREQSRLDTTADNDNRYPENVPTEPHEVTEDSVFIKELTGRSATVLKYAELRNADSIKVSARNYKTHVWDKPAIDYYFVDHLFHEPKEDYFMIDGQKYSIKKLLRSSRENKSVDMGTGPWVTDVFLVELNGQKFLLMNYQSVRYGVNSSGGEILSTIILTLNDSIEMTGYFMLADARLLSGIGTGRSPMFFGEFRGNEGKIGFLRWQDQPGDDTIKLYNYTKTGFVRNREHYIVMKSDSIQRQFHRDCSPSNYDRRRVIDTENSRWFFRLDTLKLGEK